MQLFPPDLLGTHLAPLLRSVAPSVVPETHSCFFLTLGPFFSIGTFSVFVFSYFTYGNVMTPKISPAGFGQLEILPQAHPWTSPQSFLIYFSAPRWTPPRLYVVFLERHTVLSDTTLLIHTITTLILQFTPSPGKRRGRKRTDGKESKKRQRTENTKHRDKKRRR